MLYQKFTFKTQKSYCNLKLILIKQTDGAVFSGVFPGIQKLSAQLAAVARRVTSHSAQ